MTVLQTRSRTSQVPLVVVVVTDPQLHADATARLQSQLEEVLRVRPARIVVDMSRCATVDAASLRILLDVHCRLRRVDATLTLRGVCERVRRVIGLCGLTAVFAIEESS